MTTPTNCATVLALGAVALALPDAAQACSVCQSAQNDAVQAAFLAATVFMTAMPLSLIGGAAWWLRRRARKLAEEEAAGIIRLPLPGERARRT